MTHIGHRILKFDQLESTNTYAASLANDPANNGLVVLAREQTAGRGQHGRSWHSPADQGVLMSVLLFPPPELRRPVILAAWAAVCICELISKLIEQPPRIKWPNDVLVEGRKVCGILIEQGQGTVVGIGLNVNHTAEELLTAGLPEAASLAMFAGGRQHSDAITDRLIRILGEEYELLLAGKRSYLEERWRHCLGLLGRPVVIEGHAENYHGRLLELAFDGVALEAEHGAMQHIQPEAIKHLREVTS